MKQRITIGYLLKCDLYFVQIMYLEENLYSVRPAHSSVYHFLILPTFVQHWLLHPLSKWEKYSTGTQIRSRQNSVNRNKSAVRRYNMAQCNHKLYTLQIFFTVLMWRMSPHGRVVSKWHISGIFCSRSKKSCFPTTIILDLGIIMNKTKTTSSSIYPQSLWDFDESHIGGDWNKLKV